MGAPVDIGHDLRIAPLFQLRDVLLREAEHARHGPLGQGAGEIGDEKSTGSPARALATITMIRSSTWPVIMPGVARAARPDPRIGQFPCDCARHNSGSGRNVTIEAIIASRSGICVGISPDSMICPTSSDSVGGKRSQSRTTRLISAYLVSTKASLPGVSPSPGRH